MSEYTARQRRRDPALEPRVVDVTDLTDEEEDDGNNGKPVTPPPTTTQPKQRKTKGKSKKRQQLLEEEDDYSPYLDIFRVLTFLLLASCGLSYLVSGGESYFWGMQNKPNYLKLSWWKMQYVGGEHGPYAVRTVCSGIDALFDDRIANSLLNRTALVTLHSKSWLATTARSLKDPSTFRLMATSLTSRPAATYTALAGRTTTLRASMPAAVL